MAAEAQYVSGGGREIEDGSGSGGGCDDEHQKKMIVGSKEFFPWLFPLALFLLIAPLLAHAMQEHERVL